MSARSSARFVSLLLVIGTAPSASAVDLGPAPAGPASSQSPVVALPVFLDASRLPDIQAAWRARFGGGDFVIAVPASGSSSDPEAGTINEARQTLSRGEQVSLEAAAVRERAEELSRRFAAGPSEQNGTVATPGAEPETAAVQGVVPTEPASISAEATPSAAQPEAPAQLQQVSATAGDLAGGELVGDGNAADSMTPVSMLGGPRVEQNAAPVAEVAPVIEDMATKPVPQVKRAPSNPPTRRVVQAEAQAPGLFGIFSSWGSSEEEETAPKSDDPDKNPMLPREIRSFGWNAQP